MIIALGSDHGGYQLKNEIAEMLRTEGYEPQDFGCFSEESVDYPDIARKVGEAVASGTAERGIVVCGTGVGISIAANKVPGVRAALCTDEYTARMSREHNNANILALGARVVGSELAKSIIHAWLETGFDPNTRHGQRVAKIEP